MSITYESRIPLSQFWCKVTGGGGLETLYDYLSRNVRGLIALETLKLEACKSKRYWFKIRHGKSGKRQEIPCGVDSLVRKNDLERIAFDLGWISSSEWDDSQVSWRLDTYDGRKALSIFAFVIVASRTASRRRFNITKDSTSYTWVPLHALFPDLPKDALFVGWKMTEIAAAKLQLEKVDEKYMFERLFPSIYRDYVRALLHLPIATGKRITQTVDFRDADPKALEPLLAHSHAYSPDDLFYAMVTFRVQVMVSEDGKLLAFPHLPARPAGTIFINVCQSDVAVGANILSMKPDIDGPNWCVAFPIVGTRDNFVLNLATLSHMDRFHCSNYIQENIFPHSPRNLTERVITSNFSWRMRWAYTFAKPLTIPYTTKARRRDHAYISLLKPWY